MPNNYADAIWTELKAWAKARADAGSFPTENECVAAVQESTRRVLDALGSLPEEAVKFYAAETAAMVRRFSGDIATGPDGDQQ